MNLEILIPSDEPIGLLSAVLEELDYRKLTATYSRLGRIEYPARLLFKIIVYAYISGIYSSRAIEHACWDSVCFRYLLEGHRPPDHNTISRFRSKHLPEVVEDLLHQMVQLLVKHGEISFEKSVVFIDGTKIEANAGRYTFIWKTRVTKSQMKLEEKISTEEGILLRVNRSIQAEGVFAMIKEDMNFRRFMTRGKQKVTVEWNLVSIAYNILKLHHKIQTGRLESHLVVPKTA